LLFSKIRYKFILYISLGSVNQKLIAKLELYKQSWT